ncbi:RluA family pseudouridine synthase [Ruminococcus sp. HUN007]|uniref:RluA family pseudouridine synthase n=1 Tax=Ruminococcus sp. HUN007 TaxID=1514668 RepID=UPI000678732D|nr:RluA family pseudouridine synthase [Ruminococcus sp. HUN007]
MKLRFRNESSEPVNLQFFLQKENGVSRRLITKLKRRPMGITCDGKLIRTIDDVPAGAEVILDISDENEIPPNAGLNVPVVFENDSVIVFNKPQGMPVHPSMNHYEDTLGNYFSALHPELTFRPVNRLDRNTSGLCVAAKNQHSAARLQRSVKKVYYAVICGEPEEKSGRIDAPIKRQTESLITRCVAPDGQNAVTNYQIISSCGKYSYARIDLETGRTHQIRVHFSHIGFPLAGDDLYGGSCEDVSGQTLHCGEVSFTDIKDGEIVLKAPPGENIQYLFRKYPFKEI